MEKKSTENASFVLCICIFLLLFFVIPFIYLQNKEFFNTILLKVSVFNLSFFTHFSEEALKAQEKIMSLDPKSMTFNQVKIALNYSGIWARYPFCFLLFLMGILSFLLHKKNALYRKFTMKSLSEHNSLYYPCIKPVLGKGEYLQSVESFDKGLWKIARTPIQFCVEQELVIYCNTSQKVLWEDCFKNGVANNDMPAYGKLALDKEKLNTVLTKQLGYTLGSFENLSIIEKTLAAAFLAFGNENKTLALQILDTCSFTYIEKENQATCTCFEDITFLRTIEDCYEKYSSTKSKILDCHTSFTMTWLMALLFFARKKGLLAPAQFLFLRAIDRELWYALHQCGGSVAWAEALAPWLHYQAEEKAQKSLIVFDPDPAFTFLYTHLSAQGWFLEEYHEKD